MSWPLARNRIRRGDLRHTFGMVRTNADGSKRAHQGWDLEASPGTPIYAVGDGVVESVGHAGDYGLVLVLRLTGGRWAAYCHLSRAAVTVGATVRDGDHIGETGDSGNARGMAAPDQHLHFELRTEPRPGRGLAGRVSPLELLGRCPLDVAILDHQDRH